MRAQRGPLPLDLLDGIFNSLNRTDLLSCLTVSSSWYLAIIPQVYRTLRISDTVPPKQWVDQDAPGAFGQQDVPRPVFRRAWLEKTATVEVYASLEASDVALCSDCVLPNLPNLHTLRIHLEAPTNVHGYKHPSQWRRYPWKILKDLQRKHVVVRSENALHQALLPQIAELLQSATTFTLVSGAAVSRVWNLFTSLSIPRNITKFNIVIMTNQATVYEQFDGLRQTHPSMHWAAEQSQRSNLDRALNDLLSIIARADAEVSWVHFDQPTAIDCANALNGQASDISRVPLQNLLDVVYAGTNAGVLSPFAAQLGVHINLDQSKPCPIRFLDTAQYIASEDWGAAFDEEELAPWMEMVWTPAGRKARPEEVPATERISVPRELGWLSDNSFAQFAQTEESLKRFKAEREECERRVAARRAANKADTSGMSAVDKALAELFNVGE